MVNTPASSLNFSDIFSLMEFSFFITYLCLNTNPGLLPASTFHFDWFAYPHLLHMKCLPVQIYPISDYQEKCQSCQVLEISRFAI